MGLHDDRKVDLSAVELFEQAATRLADDGHPDLRPGPIEAAQHRRSERPHEIRRHAEPHLACECRRLHRSPDIVVLAQQEARLPDQALALRGKADAGSAALEEAATEGLLEPLQLKAHGGLREIEQARSRGDAAGGNDGIEGSEQADVEISRQNRLNNNRLCNG